MSYVFKVEFADANAPHNPDLLDLIRRVFSDPLKSHVLGAYEPRLAVLKTLERLEVSCYSGMKLVGFAAIVHEYDPNVGDCVSVAMAMSDKLHPDAHFFRKVLRTAINAAHKLGVHYIAYTKTINRLEYRLMYMEV